MKTELLIFPYNGNGLEALACLNENYDFIGFIDDDSSKCGKKKDGFSVFSREALQKNPRAKILAVPGSPTAYLNRIRIIDSLKIPKIRFVNVIHKSAHISSFARIGRNVLIMAGVVITSNAVIGDNVCILPNSVIHHDAKIGNFTLIGSNVTIAGRVSVGKNCYIGSGSSIINDIKIGNKALIGMGSNVICSVKSNGRVAGNPARYI